MPRALFALALFGAVAAVSAVPPIDPAEQAKQDKDNAAAVAQVQAAKGLKVDVWAAGPLMMNPVSFAFDEKGRCFVAETTRFEKGVPDTRGHMQWLDEDLANRTIDDLLAMYKKHKYLGFEKYNDQLRVVWDSEGKGKADKSEVFSGGYNRPQDGLAAGVLARKGNVYFTCIPDLYVLRDTKGENKADVKESLFTGFGPTVQFLGHDLHGLRMGPDGKLYFSIGDRGFVVKTKEGDTLSYPNQGAVLRCDPDGKNLEVVHAGLRNPQEIAFDDFGNLFTYDNNCDSGDSARWVHIVEGGDSGWRGGFQYGTGYHTPAVPQGNRGAWNTEKIWHTQHEGQPAWIVPPLAHFGNGPAGITHYPGIGLNDKYKDHFFACDFTSNAGSSAIWALAVKPKGASFEITKPEKFLGGLVPTDCEFGPDGAFYWSDWVGGWAPQNRGRIFRATDTEVMKNPQVAEAQKLIAGDWSKKSVADLVKLLEYPHQLVRQEAQFELASREPRPVVQALGDVVRNSKDRLARLHAVWAAGQLARLKKEFATGLLVAVLRDEDAEVRRAAAEQVGSVVRHTGRFEMVPGPTEIQELLAKLLADSDDRVKAAAAVAYGKIGQTPLEIFPVGELGAYSPLFDLLRTNADKDPHLRNAAVVGLTKLARNPADLVNVWKQAVQQSRDKYDVPAVRLGVVLALRKAKSDKVVEFVGDADVRVGTEAVRAIYDERIGSGAELAKLAEKPQQPDAISFRALSANYTLGTPEAAARVAAFAARGSEADYVRAFALKLLGDWAKPPRRDPITGLIHDLPARDAQVSADALLKAGAGIFRGSDAVRQAASQAVVKLNVKEFGPAMAALVKDASAPANTRAEALYAVDALRDPATADLVTFALTTKDPKLRAAARVVQARIDPNAALAAVQELLKDNDASVAEKQAAFAVLGSYRNAETVDKLLGTWLDRAAEDMVPAALFLDVLEAAEKRTTTPKLKLFAPLKQKVDAVRAAQTKAANAPGGDKLATHFEALEGGDADRGRDLFLNNSAVYCQRCHKLDGQGGDVGPLMNGLAADKEKTRRYLLEAIVMPNAKIAKGYETVILTLADDRVVSGIIKSEDKKTVKLVTAEAKELLIPVEDVVARRTGPSAMPDDLHKKLSRRELRDLVEFLSSLKDPPKK